MLLLPQVLHLPQVASLRSRLVGKVALCLGTYGDPWGGGEFSSARHPCRSCTCTNPSLSLFLGVPSIGSIFGNMRTPCELHEEDRLQGSGAAGCGAHE